MKPCTEKLLPTVHVIDDDAGMRKSLHMLLKMANISTEVYESGDAFFEEVDGSQPGCIVLDLRMPGMSGIEVLQKLGDRHIEMPAIVISGHADVPTAVRSMKLGAVELLEKPFEPRVLLAAVERSLHQALALYERRREQLATRDRLSSLTRRELDLLKLVVGGSSNKQIAIEMGISVKTVANHRANLMAKTKAINAADLARVSVMAGIVPAKAVAKAVPQLIQ
jgi:two-component system response regulator FixJ